MNQSFLLQSLARFPKTLSHLLEDLDEQVWRYKPESGKWSILEILCHLRDEEVEDFRSRLRSTLETPSKPWPAIDPVRAAIERNYEQQDPAEVLPSFLKERTASLDWLHTLGDADWNLSYHHPKLGEIAAGQLLGSWAAHDLLHLRQVTKRLFEATQIASEPFDVDYAGSW